MYESQSGCAPPSTSESEAPIGEGTQHAVLSSVICLSVLVFEVTQNNVAVTQTDDGLELLVQICHLLSQ